MDQAIACFNLIFSPISFLIFLIISTPFKKFIYTSLSTNVSRLYILPYLLYCLLLYILLEGVIGAYNAVAIKSITVTAWLQPTIFVFSILTWLATAFTLFTFTISGMEGNILGCIFAPILIISSLTSILIYLFEIIFR